MSIISTINDAFLAAPFQDNGLNIALAQLADATGSSWAHLLAVGGASDVKFNCLSQNPSDQWDQHFSEIGGGNPATNWRVALADPISQIVDERHYDNFKGLKRYADYDDFVHHYDMAHGCQTTLHKDKNRFFGLATLRSERDGRTGEDDRALFVQAAPSVMSAIRLQLAADHQAERILRGTMESMDILAFICDSQARVLDQTAKAEAFLSTSKCLGASRETLYCERTSDDTRLKTAISEVTASTAGTELREIWARGREGIRTGCILQIFRLPHQMNGFQLESKAVVIVKHLREWDNRHVPLLQNIYDLTTAEAEIALQVANGHNREAIAQQRTAATTTVNTQLRSIFRKTEVTREIELASMINRILK